MRIRFLQCFLCRLKFRSGNVQQVRQPQRCGCGGSVVVHYDWSRVNLSWSRLRSRPFTHWRYKEFFPPIREPLEMGEGGTPIVPSIKHTGWYFKIEGQNPTGSFKDRGSAVEISLARQQRARRVVLASTGNMGASVAAYCARAGLECEVVLPKNTNPEKISEIASFGAAITKVSGDYTKASTIAFSKSKQKGWTLAGDYTYRREGEKSLAFEIADQLGLVDYVVVPVGNGTMISGVWKGFKELYAARLIHKLPALIAVQAAGCMPIVQALKSKTPIKPVIPRTMAHAVACGAPLDGDLALLSIVESRGKAIAVTDPEIIQARRMLARTEGLDAEPSGAASVAGALKLKLPRSALTVFILSGSGLKDLGNV